MWDKKKPKDERKKTPSTLFRSRLLFHRSRPSLTLLLHETQQDTQQTASFPYSQTSPSMPLFKSIRETMQNRLGLCFNMKSSCCFLQHSIQHQNIEKEKSLKTKDKQLLHSFQYCCDIRETLIDERKPQFVKDSQNEPERVTKVDHHSSTQRGTITLGSRTQTKHT